MFPASTTMTGQCFGMPDVCLTPAPPAPPVPVPYPNIGMVMQAVNVSTKVKFMNKEAVLLKSKIPRSMGDEAGVNGGVMSGMNMGEIAFKMGTSILSVEGIPVIRLLSISGHNGMNANMPAGMQVAPSQTKVLVM